MIFIYDQIGVLMHGKNRAGSKYQSSTKIDEY